MVDGTAASHRHGWKSNNSSYWCRLEKDTLWGPSTPGFMPPLPGAMKSSTLKEAYWLSLEFNSHGILKLEDMRRPVVFHLVLLLLFYFYSSIKYYHTDPFVFVFYPFSSTNGSRKGSHGSIVSSLKTHALTLYSRRQKLRDKAICLRDRVGPPWSSHSELRYPHFQTFPLPLLVS